MMIELMLITVLAIASIGLAMFLGSSKKKPGNGLGDHEELSGYAHASSATMNPMPDHAGNLNVPLCIDRV